MIVRSIETIIRMLDADYIENGDIEEKIQGVCIDSRRVVEGNLYIPIRGVNNNGHAFVQQAIENGAKAVLWERKEVLIPPKDVVVIIVDDTTKALAQLAREYRQQLKMKVVGITGSNGKTSTKDMLASVLSQRYITQKTLGNYNNEIGVPLTILSFSEDVEVGVIEMGMENLGEISYLSKLVEPDIAIITNVGTAHLENLKTMENIAKAKVEIAEGLKTGGLLIYNGDQKLLANTVKMAEIPGMIGIRTFGCQSHNDVVVSNIRQMRNHLSFSLNKDRYRLDMLGKHQAINAASIYLVANALGLTKEEMQTGFDHVEKTGLRNELIQCNQCLILNDSYKSNPQSALAALDTLQAFKSPYKIAILGDMLELGEVSNQIHYQLGKCICQYDIQEVLTIGNMARYIAQGVWNHASHIKVQHFSDQEALKMYVQPYVNQACMILVKGSRGMKLDVLVEELQKGE